MFSYLVFTKLEGAVTSGMIHLGDKLGLYRAMRDAAAPLRSGELAERTGLHERWVREWAYNQAAARIIDCDDDERFSLSEEAAAVLATPDDPAYGMGMFHRFPNTMDSLRDMPESFRTGLGHDYDSHGPEAAVGIERAFEPWNRANLLPVVLPALDGVTERLAGRHHRRRRGLRRGRRTVADGRRVPELHVPRLRHQSVCVAPRRGEATGSGRGQRVVPRSAR